MLREGTIMQSLNAINPNVVELPKGTASSLL
jgi:hypothetical protein